MKPSSAALVRAHVCEAFLLIETRDCLDNSIFFFNSQVVDTSRGKALADEFNIKVRFVCIKVHLRCI